MKKPPFFKESQALKEKSKNSRVFQVAYEPCLYRKCEFYLDQKKIILWKLLSVDQNSIDDRKEI